MSEVTRPQVAGGCVCLGAYGLVKSHGAHPPEWLVSSDCTLTLMDPNRSGPDSDLKQKGLLGSL